MDLLIVGIVLEFVGSLFIAFTALMVNHRILHEHKVDEVVLTTMRMEQYVGFFGVILLIIGFVLQVVSFLS